MAIQVKRATGVTPNPAIISGVDLMVQLNQSTFTKEQVLGIEKVGNNFEVMYVHDTTKEGINTTYGLIFADENANIPNTNSVISLANDYIGKFDLGGQPKHVFFV